MIESVESFDLEKKRMQNIQYIVIKLGGFVR